jgi:ribose 5-phosphate isomerase B
MTLIIGSDHAGVALKQALRQHLEKKGLAVQDVGPTSTESVDYPDFARLVTTAVLEQSSNVGILICGSGIGMSIAANKVKGIRAALVTSVEMAQMTKRHNNANVLCLSARMVPEDTNLAMVDAWLNEEFEGGRHQRRLDKIE